MNATTTIPLLIEDPWPGATVPGSCDVHTMGWTTWPLAWLPFAVACALRLDVRLHTICTLGQAIASGQVDHPIGRDHGFISVQLPVTATEVDQHLLAVLCMARDGDGANDNVRGPTDMLYDLLCRTAPVCVEVLAIDMRFTRARLLAPCGWAVYGVAQPYTPSGPAAPCCTRLGGEHHIPRAARCTRKRSAESLQIRRSTGR